MFRYCLGAALICLSSPAYAEWQHEANEGGNYAWITDGGFVEGSYQNGMSLFCPDAEPADFDPSDRRHRSVLCEFRVTLGGEMPRPPAIVSFRFDNDAVVERVSERVRGGKPQIWLGGELIELMLSRKSVTISDKNGARHTFSLTGSAKALRNTMGFASDQTATQIKRVTEQ